MLECKITDMMNNRSRRRHWQPERWRWVGRGRPRGFAGSFLGVRRWWGIVLR